MANFSMVYARSALCDARFGQKAYGLRGFGRIGCVNQGVFGQKTGIGAKAAKRRGRYRERTGDGVAGAMTAGEGREGDAAAGRGVNPRVSGRGREGVSLRVSGRGGRTRGSPVGGECARVDGRGANPRVAGQGGVRDAAVAQGAANARGCERAGGECGQRSRGGAKRAGATNSAACCAGLISPELAALGVRLSTLQRPASSAPPSPPPARTATWLALPRFVREVGSYGPSATLGPVREAMTGRPSTCLRSSSALRTRQPRPRRPARAPAALSRPMPPPDRSALGGSGSPAWRRCA